MFRQTHACRFACIMWLESGSTNFRRRAASPGAHTHGFVRLSSVGDRARALSQDGEQQPGPILGPDHSCPIARGGRTGGVWAIRARGQTRCLVAVQARDLLRENLAEKAAARTASAEDLSQNDLEARAACMTLVFAVSTLACNVWCGSWHRPPCMSCPVQYT